MTDKKVAVRIARERARYWNAVADKLGGPVKESRLVDDWRNAWRWLSTWFNALSSLLIGVLLLVPSMPQEVQNLVPVEWRAVAIASWFGLGVLARVVKQRG